jgi:pseudouridine-5'-phosphate glycosidase
MTRLQSRRDLPILVAHGGAPAQRGGRDEIIAALADIRVFATGGIGGAHRGAELSLDVSADLQELARTPVAVVCAGAKSTFDIRLTLEYLETHGVPMIGYRTDSLPTFFSRDHAFGVDARLDEPDEIARVTRAKWKLGLGGGLVVANPILAQYALRREVVDRAIRPGIGGRARAGYHRQVGIHHFCWPESARRPGAKACLETSSSYCTTRGWRRR